MSKKNIKKILVVGGAGYIGSHMTQLLLDKGLIPVIFDRVKLRPQQRLPKIAFIKGDLRSFKDIDQAIKKTKPDLIMYFAGLIIAPESNVDPVKYLDNNVLAAVNLLKAMHANGINKIIFSSTAAVYGNPKSVPIKETEGLKPINTYGYTKLMFEQMLQSMANAHEDFSFIALRYFNAAGAHQKGHLGECHEPETHLIPNILRTIKGTLKELIIYGDDYSTKDGTCIRDYIHVEDLTAAHFLAIKALDKGIRNQMFNLGSGAGYSVKEIVKTVEKVTGKKVNLTIGPRRPGDPAKLIASSSKANKILGWKPTRSLQTIVQSAWAWEQQLP